MNQRKLAEFLEAAAAEMQRRTAHLPQPIMSLYVSQDGKSVDLCLDGSQSTYSDWIKGEGGDISLVRVQQSHRVNGAHLPLYAKTLIVGGSNFPTVTINLETGVVEIDPPA